MYSLEQDLPLPCLTTIGIRLHRSRHEMQFCATRFLMLGCYLLTPLLHKPEDEWIWYGEECRPRIWLQNPREMIECAERGIRVDRVRRERDKAGQLGELDGARATTRKPQSLFRRIYIFVRDKLILIEHGHVFIGRQVKICL